MSLRRRIARRKEEPPQERTECSVCALEAPRNEAALPVHWVGALEVNPSNRELVRFRFLLCDACAPLVEAFIKHTRAKNNELQGN